METLRMCARLIPNLPGTGVIPVGPISFNEALVVVFALPPNPHPSPASLRLMKAFVTTLSMDVVL
ncbi:Small ribosomal subunit biogenesis GTPase RsgA, partial [Clarias magur]